ncbi:MAG: hypothetical protein L0Z50_00145 [Verrucomicrobiales bacterium]|nr:hypothetical protein [Verrucomicrobiales bacterium]
MALAGTGALPVWGASPSTQLTYQGRLKVRGGTPDPTARFDLRLHLYDGPSGGSHLDEAVAQGITVQSNELFTVTIDAHPTWNSSAAAHWVELDVRRSGTTDNYVTLAPRQRITAVPEALRAQQAEVARGLAGPLPAAQLPPNAARLDQPQTFTVAPLFNPTAGPPFQVGQTGTVQKLSADLLDGLDSTAFWRRDTSAGVSSIIDPQDTPIEIRARNNLMLRLQPGDSNLGSSLVGGSANNKIEPGVPGSVVAGGRNNLIQSNAPYSVVTGGDGNQISVGARESVIGGGARQMIGAGSIYSGIFGGYNNLVSPNSRFAGVLLGNAGKVRENSDFSVVISGDNNGIGPQAPSAAILSGAANKIESGANHSLIGSGQQNMIGTQANHSAVMAGQLNQIHSGAQRSFIGGGNMNSIGPSAYNALLGGGGDNKIEFNAHHSAILGGQLNLVRSNASWATVLGGVESVAGEPFAMAGGHGAKAEHSGSIVLADGQYANFASVKANEFAVRAAGGVRFVTGGAGLFVDGQRVLGSDANIGSNGADAETADGSARFWKLDGNAGTTAGPNFVGTTGDQPLELKVKNRRAFRLEPTAGSPNVVGGDDGNSVSRGVFGAAIGGGGSPGLFGVAFPNRITDSYSVVAGGFDNRAGNDNGNAQDSLGATVGGGFANHAAAEWAFTGGGNSNVVRAAAAAIAGGQQNVIETNAPFAAIAGGLQARASLYGQAAHASGSFSQPGDAQASLYVLRGTTRPWSLNAQEPGLNVLLKLDGGMRQLRFPPNTAWTFDILIVAEREDGASAGYQIQGVVKSVRSDAVFPLYEGKFVGTPRVTVLGEDAAVEDWSVSVATIGDGLIGERPGAGLSIQVTDLYEALPVLSSSPGPATRWVASVRTVEVRH